jgi:hypothetical protein
MQHLQDGFAWGSGSIGLLFLFIILLIVVLTWRRCPSCYCGSAETPLQPPLPETQLTQKHSDKCGLLAQGNPKAYMFKCTTYPDIHHSD